MLAFLVKLIVGVILALLPLCLLARYLTRLIRTIFRYREEEVPEVSRSQLTRILFIMLWAAIEFAGIHLVFDLIAPGQAAVYVHAAKQGVDFPFVMENTRIQIAPVKFTGDPDFRRYHEGRFDHTGTYQQLVAFNWCESRVFLRVYDLASHRSLLERYIHISPYARVSSAEKHIYVIGKRRQASSPVIPTATEFTHRDMLSRALQESGTAEPTTGAKSYQSNQTRQ